MSTDKDFVRYLAAVRALQSDDPKVRRPAISMLLELARQDPGAVPAHAERALTEEFGPYAVSDGLSGCSAPIEAVNACDGDCRSCIWLWEDRPVPSFQRSSIMVADLDPVGETHSALALPGSHFGQCWASAVQWCNRLREYLRWAKAPRKRLEVVTSRRVRSFRMPRLSEIRAPGGHKKTAPGGGTGLVETRDQPGHEGLDQNESVHRRLKTDANTRSGVVRLAWPYGSWQPVRHGRYRQAGSGDGGGYRDPPGQPLIGMGRVAAHRRRNGPRTAAWDGGRIGGSEADRPWKPRNCS